VSGPPALQYGCLVSQSVRPHPAPATLRHAAVEGRPHAVVVPDQLAPPAAQPLQLHARPVQRNCCVGHEQGVCICSWPLRPAGRQACSKRDNARYDAVRFDGYVQLCEVTAAIITRMQPIELSSGARQTPDRPPEPKYYVTVLQHSTRAQAAESSTRTTTAAGHTHPTAFCSLYSCVPPCSAQ
jgi:hypothetical protein